jgi:hypothetical protein
MQQLEPNRRTLLGDVPAFFVGAGRGAQVSRRSRGRPGTGGVRASTALLACIGLALALGAVARSAAGPAPSFAAAKNYATGWGFDIALGDLNGDGKVDLVTTNQAGLAGGFSVLLNRGSGRFGAPARYGDATEYSASVAIGDLDGNRTQDVVVSNLSGTVSVFLNRGDGTFQPEHRYRVPGEPYSVALGDLNGDGSLDIVTANAKANTVSVLLNRGDGSFGPKVDYPTGRTPGDVRLGDLNGDGSLDLATSNASGNSVSVLLNRGDGTFQGKRDYRASRSNALAVGDLNGDGKPDLVSAMRCNAVSVLINRGDGTFKAAGQYASGGEGGCGPYAVAIGDLNGDGKVDVATATGSPSGEVSVLLNRGDGHFQPPLEYRVPGGGDAESVEIGDLNGSGKLDIVTVNGSAGTVSVLINTPGLCDVQRVTGMALASAKRMLARVNCAVRKIRRVYAPWPRKGFVISQKPGFGAVRPKGAKVDLLVSLGRRR